MSHWLPSCWYSANYVLPFSTYAQARDRQTDRQWSSLHSAPILLGQEHNITHCSCILALYSWYLWNIDVTDSRLMCELFNIVEIIVVVVMHCLGGTTGSEHNCARFCRRHRQSSNDPHWQGIVCKISWYSHDTQPPTQHKPSHWYSFKTATDAVL